jgi:hypothetical protein
MWVIRSFSDLAEKRTSTLNSVLDNSDKDIFEYKSFISDSNSKFKKISITNRLSNAKIYKSKSGAEKYKLKVYELNNLRSKYKLP